MSGLTLQHFLVFAALLFCVGLYGLLTRRNLIGMLMAVELILNAAALNFVAFHHYLHAGEVAGVIFPLFIIAVAAAEVAIALAVVIVIFRHQGRLNVEEVGHMRH
jgi:NADH:ubiquinone oxidoreductase subunit K